jgi:polysaccharide export outer membrane protein
MKSLVCASAILATTLSGCAYGPNGGRVGEAGQVQVLANTSLPEPSAMDTVAESRPYFVGPQDELIIDVFDIESLKEREIHVDGAGRIALPLAGTMVAAGLTPEQLSALIAERLRANFVRDPRVSVNVKKAVSQIVTVDGDVIEPGRYPVIGDTTLLDAVASAKGASKYAKLDDVIILRTVNGNRYAGVYNVAAIRRGNYPDPHVYANDEVIVGDSPARRRLEDFMTILPALTSPLIYLLANNGSNGSN